MRLQIYTLFVLIQVIARVLRGIVDNLSLLLIRLTLKVVLNCFFIEK